MPSLIVTEKPNVAKRIASTLGDAVAERRGQVTFYRVGDVYVAAAVGHIYGLKQDASGWGFPVFDVKWVPSYKINSSSSFTKKYLDVLVDLGKKCGDFINACDYDIEGEVIGYNVIKHACKAKPYSKHVKRMKYSTLTKDSILKAYEDLGEMDEGMIEAGLTRHTLDWFWGINMSRALSQSARRGGRYKTLSIGRVQGPALRLLAARERKIKAFKPKDFWEVELDCVKDEIDFTAMHVEGKFWEKDKAVKAHERCGDKATVVKISKRKTRQKPPNPFDLTTLQTEAYRHHRISPAETLKIAQTLYTNALISYPRTSSKQLPDDIDVKKIIESLKSQEDYSVLCEKLLSRKKLKPNNGRKSDPAHPAIHPTGEKPGRLSGRDQKIYDLIVRRFMATFGDPAVRESVKGELDNNGELFTVKGTATVEPNWHVYYGPYAKFKETTLPAMSKGDVVDVKDVKLNEKETQPPKRYTPAGIIRELEKRNLGTKATRSSIIDILFKRGYLTGKSIEVTPLGLKVVETLKKHCPDVISDKMTRMFEEEMVEIQEGKLTRDDVISEAREAITKISDDFKKNSGKIGGELAETLDSTVNQLKYLTDCPDCGKKLVIRRSRKGNQFVGCTGYPKCTHTKPLPQGKIEKIGDCQHCDSVQLKSIKKGKRPFIFCLNMDCPGRKKRFENKKNKKE